MRVFIQELKKILRPLPLFILAVFTALYAFVVMESPFAYMTKVHETSDMVALCADLIELCGPTLEPEEVESAVKTLTDRYKSELEEAIRANPLFAEAGVTDYESYCVLEMKIDYSFVDAKYTQEDGVEIDYQLYDWPPYDPNEDYTLTAAEQKIADQYLMGDMVPAIKLRLLTENLTSQYERISVNEEFFTGKLDLEIAEAGQARINEIYNSDEIRNILPGWSMEYIKQIFPMLSIMILAALCILLAPVITKDNMNGITSLQYSSKAGRKTLGIQLAAMLSVAFMIAMVETAVIFGLFIKGAWHSFLGSGLSSFVDPYSYNWFSGNYGQYLIILAILLLTVSLAAAMLIFLFSKLCKNYISLLLGVVPLSGMLIFLCYQIFKDPFAIISSDHRSLYQMIPVAYMEVYIAGVLLLIGAAVSVLILKKQKRVEVV